MNDHRAADSDPEALSNRAANGNDHGDLSRLSGKLDALELRTETRWLKFETDFGQFAEQVFGRFGDVVISIERIDSQLGRVKDDVRASLEGHARNEARQKKLESRIAIGRVEVDREIADLRRSSAPPDGSGPLIALGTKAAEIALQERAQSHHEIEREARDAIHREVEREKADAAEIAKEAREKREHRVQWALGLAASLLVLAATAFISARLGAATAIHAPTTNQGHP
jgi:hypothetical protein